MSKELEKNYNPSEIEDRLYQKWLDKKYFHAEVDRSKKPFTIVMPPPNITGKLHMGHALDNTMQDILIRFKRMQGYEALWVPGTDHASISTEVKVTNALKEEGIDKHELGREGFLKRTWEWKKEYGGTITSQLRKIGSSCDWDRERFTMDEGCSKAVQTVFINLYNKGLIYKGSRIVNWCPVCNTSISDAEVEHEEQAGHFWHINYPVVGEDGRFVEIATTRPETLLGDSALAVNPKDDRYKDLIGKQVQLPLTDRTIPVIADEYVDMEFGTGVVKITPAHDPNDFEVGKRHNLPEINILNDDATINNLGGKYAGMDRYEARKAMVADLDALGLLVKVEDHVHNVGTHDRCKTTVEPMIKQQWFVKMDELIKPAVEGVKNGDIELMPASMDKTYFNWTDNIRDWCISRQLWWGHRIPAWYKDEEIYVGMEKPKGDGWIQDDDVLDTWFSSALWPFSTLGWPKDTKDLKRYFPIDCLVTGYDIIFFWVARMAIDSKHFMNQRPFKKCLIHGLIRDEEGRKMSKSLGNVVDPFDIIDKYGCDAMRYFLTTNSTPGQDLRFSDEKMASSWNYINKIWNVSRFIKMNLVANNYQGEEIDYNNLTSLDKWILNKMNLLIKDVDSKYDIFEFGEVARAIYNFTWDDFASSYLEMTKVDFANSDLKRKINTCSVLTKVLTTIIKLLHPFMPFVTEEIYQNFYDESIMISDWPQSLNLNLDNDLIAYTNKLFEIITAVRNIRNEKNVPMSKPIKISLETSNIGLKTYLLEHREYLKKFINYEELLIVDSIDKMDAIVKVLDDLNIVILLKELVNVDEEIAKLKLKQDKLKKEVARSESMLNNQNFLQKAPSSKIIEERNKLSSYLEQLKEVNALLLGLEK